MTSFLHIYNTKMKVELLVKSEVPFVAFTKGLGVTEKDWCSGQNSGDCYIVPIQVCDACIEYMLSNLIQENSITGMFPACSSLDSWSLHLRAMKT